MKKLFYKFKLKWWSWEIDSTSIFMTIFLGLLFLPILPHEKKEGKLISVIGFEASVSNFYALGLSNDSNPKEGDAFYGLDKHFEETKIISLKEQKNFLLKKGYSEDLASCISKRDYFLWLGFDVGEMRYHIRTYPPSPVPLIWVTRALISHIVFDHMISMDIRADQFKKLQKNCLQFGDTMPPKDYLKGKYNYSEK
tara:strand:- start:145 stop:732 length:588 start_codon:yes stop_codon:yes gene_type:complete